MRPREVVEIIRSTPRFRTRIACLTVAAACVAGLGCGHLVIPRVVAVPASSPPARFLVGAARVDFTPPPGFPTAGYGPAGDLARGYWNRLYARAFYFEDTSGRPLVLVSCDLMAIPAGLHDAVVRQAAKVLRSQVALSNEAVIIAATHTHHGPGNYFSAKLYNDHGSSYSGFDRRMFEHLRDRIALAITRAYEDAVAGRGAASLVVRVGRFAALKNREPRSFLLNPGAQELMTMLRVPARVRCKPQPLEAPTPELADGWDLPGCPRLRAVDRALTVVEVKRGTEAIGRMVFLAVHPTVLVPSTPLYSPDFVGYAVGRLERELGGRQVVAFFNGPEGDVVARRRSRDYRDVVRMGRRLHGRLVYTEDHPLDRRDIALDAARIDVRAEDRTASGATCSFGNADGTGVATLAKRPGYGTAAFGGGEDDHTILYELGWRAGVRDRDRDGQGPKLGPLDSRLLRPFRLSGLAAPAESFPRRIPLTVAQLGDFTVASFPTEMNTAQGLKIRRALGMDRTRTVLVGLADEYIGYTTTSAEYWRQDYMGASTVWGPSQGDFIQCRLAQLHAEAPPPPPSTDLGTRGYEPGPPPCDTFGLDLVGERTARADDELDNVLRDAHQAPRRDLPTFEWDETCPRHCRSDDFCAMDRRHVTMEQYDPVLGWIPARDESQVVDDDRGFRLMIVARGHAIGAKHQDPQRWAAIWTAPLLDPKLAGTFRFRVATCAPDSPRCSEGFTVSAATPSVLHETSCDP